jgi:hypothetical protein
MTKPNPFPVKHLLGALALSVALGGGLAYEAKTAINTRAEQIGLVLAANLIAEERREYTTFLVEYGFISQQGVPGSCEVVAEVLRDGGAVTITSPWGYKYPVQAVLCHAKAAEVAE